MKESITVLVLLPLNEAEKRELEAIAPNHYLYPEGGEPDPDMIRKSHVILGNVPPESLKLAENLKWLQLHSAGAEEYITCGWFPAGTVLTNASGAYGPAIAEHMLAMLLTIQKKLYVYHEQKERTEWKSAGPVTSIDGSTTLMIGLGDVGSCFASRMKSLGSAIIGVKRHKTQKPDFIDELYLTDELDVLLPRADIVALALPHTPKTHQLMNFNRLKALKKTAVLLNVGRGQAIDTEALCDLMEQGHLLGAGLDVTDPEPLPPDHRLWKIKNVVITPHVAGGYHLPATRSRIVQIALENYARYQNHEPLKNVVDFSQGY